MKSIDTRNIANWTNDRQMFCLRPITTRYPFRFIQFRVRKTLLSFIISLLHITIIITSLFIFIYFMIAPVYPFVRYNDQPTHYLSLSFSSHFLPLSSTRSNVTLTVGSYETISPRAFLLRRGLYRQVDRRISLDRNCPPPFSQLVDVWRESALFDRHCVDGVDVLFVSKYHSCGVETIATINPPVSSCRIIRDSEHICGYIFAAGNTRQRHLRTGRENKNKLFEEENRRSSGEW